MKKKPKTFEDQMYILGLLCIPVGILIILCFNRVFQWMHDINYTCVFQDITGFYCPGCGGTRATNFLLHGHFLKSLIYHPFPITTIVMYLIFMVSHTISLINPKHKGMEIQEWHAFLLLFLVIGNFIVKNILLYNGIIILK